MPAGTARAERTLTAPRQAHSAEKFCNRSLRSCLTQCSGATDNLKSCWVALCQGLPRCSASRVCLGWPYCRPSTGTELSPMTATTPTRFTGISSRITPSDRTTASSAQSQTTTAPSSGSRFRSLVPSRQHRCFRTASSSSIRCRYRRPSRSFAERVNRFTPRFTIRRGQDRSASALLPLSSSDLI
jgi:hypothetical protein